MSFTDSELWCVFISVFITFYERDVFKLLPNPNLSLVKLILLVSRKSQAKQNNKNEAASFKTPPVKDSVSRLPWCSLSVCASSLNILH